MTWEKLEPHRFPHAFEAEILVKLTDGSSRSIRLDDVFGNASRPAGDEAVLQKFRANVKRALRPGSADDLITWGYSIERGATLDELNKILSRRMP
jgi:hypothetical protein